MVTDRFKTLVFGCAFVLCELASPGSGEEVGPSIASTNSPGAHDPRLILDFNTAWAFHLGDVERGEKPDYNDASWAAVSIPHTIRLERKHCGGEIFQGIAWYRRHFAADPAWNGRCITVDFEGIQMESEIYLNGNRIATRAGGYMGFSVDITGSIRFDMPNLLAVKVSNLDNPDVPPGRPNERLDFIVIPQSFLSRRRGAELFENGLVTRGEHFRWGA